MRKLEDRVAILTGGSIVNISSNASTSTPANAAVYNATKAAVLVAGGLR